MTLFRSPFEFLPGTEFSCTSKALYFYRQKYTMSSIHVENKFVLPETASQNDTAMNFMLPLKLNSTDISAQITKLDTLKTKSEHFLKVNR